MTGLSGTYAVSLDTNGRLAIPKHIRNDFPEGQQDKVIVTRGMGKFVAGYYEEKWNSFIENIENLDISYLEKAAMMRRFVAQSSTAGFDKQGRITIPNRLLELASMEKGSEVLVIGCVNHIEIWNPDLFNAEDTNNEDLVQGVMGRLDI